MKKVYIKTYGCQMNERDSQDLSAKLIASGFEMVSDEENADVILLNTCSIRELAEQKAIGKAGHILAKNRNKKNPPIIGFMGCMAQSKKDSILKTYPDTKLIVGTQKHHKIPEYLHKIFADLEEEQKLAKLEEEKNLGKTANQNQKQEKKFKEKIKHAVVDTQDDKFSHAFVKDHILDNKKPSRFVSIMQGCQMKCSYCIVPFTRGLERSRTIEDIYEEVSLLAKNGTKEVMLLGQIVTSYGKREFPKVDGKSPFVQLLEKLSSIESLEIIRFASAHPKGFDDDLINAFGYLPKLGNWVHLPLQSGSNKVLKEMKRPYTSEAFLEIVRKLKIANPNISITTDIIVGFPNETEEDFLETKKIFDMNIFDMAYIFKYSPRTGTASSLLEDNVADSDKEKRNQILLDIIKNQSIERNKTLINSTQSVLVESLAKRGQSTYIGRTLNYTKTIIDSPETNLIGKTVKVKIIDATFTNLVGQLIK